MKKVLVTGSAGFIGYHLSTRLLKENYYVIGIDNINSYYSTLLKEERINQIRKIANKNNSNWKFYKININEERKLKRIFEDHQPHMVIHLAAQAGVRYSLENPREYINSNILGFYNIIELSNLYNVKSFIYASSSSVYGGNTKLPFSEKDSVNKPLSLYAATKLSNELIAHTYSHLYGLNCFGLRFFTVYGPWGRPDMAPMIFAKAIFEKKKIKIFNQGNMTRDFTYIDDIVESITRLLNKIPTKNLDKDPDFADQSKNLTSHEILNIGNGKSINIIEFIKTLEDEIGCKAIKSYEDMQLGDVQETLADTKYIERLTDFKPNTSIKSGVKQFIKWYKEFYKKK